MEYVNFTIVKHHQYLEENIKIMFQKDMVTIKHQIHFLKEYGIEII